MPKFAKIRSSLAAFKKDEDGLAFVEFAIVLTVLAALLPGSWEVTNALLVKRKVNQVATVLADLTTQAATINQISYNNMTLMTKQILHPYEHFNTRMRIIGVRVDANKKITTAWSYGNATLSSASLPPNLIIKNSFYVMSASEVDYQPIFGRRFVGDIRMRNTSIASPRLSATVEKN